ncbi:MAG: DUF3551 domain-containing protein [Bradyrhizobium sp.]|nr:DUF3551 domain-containing protein [Bradyrhizobium sp.]
MRPQAWTVLVVIEMILAATPAWAQTYDPNYPVCLQVYGDKGDYISCSYSSLAQCASSASGRGARCFQNPFFVHASSVGLCRAGIRGNAAVTDLLRSTLSGVF